jgi:hypothetical protein
VGRKKHAAEQILQKLREAEIVLAQGQRVGAAGPGAILCPAGSPQPSSNPPARGCLECLTGPSSGSPQTHCSRALQTRA